MEKRTGLVKLRQRDSLRPLNIFVSQGLGAVSEFQIETNIQTGIYPCKSTNGGGFSFIMEVSSTIEGIVTPFTVEAPNWVGISVTGSTINGTIEVNEGGHARVGTIKVKQTGTTKVKEFTVTQAECGVAYKFLTDSTVNIDANVEEVTLNITSKKGSNTVPYTYDGQLPGVVVNPNGTCTVSIGKNQSPVEREYVLYFIQEESNYSLMVTIIQKAEELTYMFSLLDDTVTVPCEGGEFSIPVLSTYTGNAGSSGVAELEITSAPEWVTEVQREDGTKILIYKNEL